MSVFHKGRWYDARRPAERNAALAMIEPLANRPTGITLGAAKG